MTSRSLVDIDQAFGWNRMFSSLGKRITAMKMEGAFSSDTLINVYQTSWRIIICKECVLNFWVWIVWVLLSLLVPHVFKASYVKSKIVLLPNKLSTAPWKMDVLVHVFLTWVLDGGEFYLRGMSPPVPLGLEVGPQNRSGQRWEKSYPYWASKSIQCITSRYTDYAIPTIVEQHYVIEIQISMNL
jgi:hypothetical protein